MFEKPEPITGDDPTTTSAGTASLSNSSKSGRPRKRARLFHFVTVLDVLLLTIATILSLAAGVLFPIFLGYFGDLFDSISGLSAHEPNWYILLELRFGAVAFACCFLGAGMMEVVAERQLYALKRNFLKAVLRQELAWFDQFDPQVLSATLSQNTVLIRDAMGLKTSQLLLFIGSAVGGYVVAMLRGWRLTVVLTACVPLIAIGGYWAVHSMGVAFDKSRGSFGKAAAWAEQAFASMRVIVAYGLEAHMSQTFNGLVEQAYKAALKGAVYLGCGVGMTLSSLFFTYSLGFWYGGKLFADDIDNHGYLPCVTRQYNCFTAGQVLAVLFCVVISAFSIGQATPGYSTFAKAHAAMHYMCDILYRESLLDSTQETYGVKPTLPIKGDIEFRHVRFSYPTRPDMPIFEDLNLNIPAGSSVALVGASGCGKSTIVQLVDRLYDVTGGKILIDGVDIRDYNVRWLRQHISLVSQEPKLFANTITYNIKCGASGTGQDVAEADIHKVAQDASVYGFVMSLQEQFDTYAGASGSQFSGGQRQRIALARALIRSPSILILDEATSALDSESERQLQETLFEILEQRTRTTLIVAHRLSTVRKADRIVVLENTGHGAKVAEQGTHDELMQIPNGLYAALVTSQMADGPDEAAPLEDILDIMGNMDDSFVAREASIMKLKAKFLSDGDVGAVKESKPKRYCRQSRACTHGFRTKRMFKMIWPYKIQVTLGLLGAIINGLLHPLFAWALSLYIPAFYMADTVEVRHKGSVWGGVFCGIAVAAFLASLLQQGFFGWAGERVVKVLRQQAFASVVYQDMSFFDKPSHSSGALTDILISDVLMCRGWIGDSLGIHCQNTVSLVAACVIAFTASAKLAGVCLAGFAAEVIAVFLEYILISSGSAEALPSVGDEDIVLEETVAHILSECLTHLKTIAAYTMEDEFNQRYQAVLNREYSKVKYKSVKVGFGWGVSQLMQYLVQALYMWYGAKLVTDGEITPALMIRCLMALLMSAMGMGQALIFVTDKKKAKAAADRVFRIIESRPAIDARHPSGVIMTELKQSIEFDKVRFVYPQRQDHPLYENLSFSIPRGEVVALVGPSGCGKSTVVQLLERFYDVTAGSITVDGISLKDFNVRTLRQHIGLVCQEPSLFDMTIEENIALGRSAAPPSISEIREAARLANADSFIDSFPDKYQTKVGTGGSQLSGGQKQRIALARALIRQPSILILDEATSALDPNNEALVQEALDKLVAEHKHTTLVIAHRLSTIRNANKIVVLVNHARNGSRVAELGSHDELMQLPNGVYRGLVKIAQGT